MLVLINEGRKFLEEHRFRMRLRVVPFELGALSPPSNWASIDRALLENGTVEKPHG